VGIEIPRDGPLVFGFEEFEIRIATPEENDVHAVEALLVDDRCIEQGGVSVGEFPGVVGSDAGVIEVHTTSPGPATEYPSIESAVLQSCVTRSVGRSGSSIVSSTCV